MNEAEAFLHKAKTSARQGAEAFLRIRSRTNPKLSSDPNALERLEVTILIDGLFVGLPEETRKLLGSLLIAQKALTELKQASLKDISQANSMVEQARSRQHKLITDAEALVQRYKSQLGESQILETLDETQCFILQREFLAEPSWN